jgi:hypothetical protein
MWQDVIIIGFLLFLLTGLLYWVAATVLRRAGLSLWEQDGKKSFVEISVEFTTSVILSFLASAALGFLYVGILGMVGVPIGIP